jgi:hypothetical protein
LGAVLGSQLFSGFWIGWMIEHPTNSNSENPKKLDFQHTFNVKNGCGTLTHYKSNSNTLKNLVVLIIKFLKAVFFVKNAPKMVL